MQLQYFPGKSGWVGGGWLNQGDLPIQIMDKSTFSNRKLTYPRYRKVNLFDGRLINLLLWMQWISLEGLLNIYVHVVFYMYTHVSC